MAKQTPLHLFLGEDHSFVFTILNDLETAAVDITGWALSWMIKRSTNDLDAAALLTKTTGAGIAISGTFNATPSVNTQIATVSILDTDTTGLSEGLCRYELKRTDANAETILAYGTIELIRAVHR